MGQLDSNFELPNLKLTLARQMELIRRPAQLAGGAGAAGSLQGQMNVD